MVQLPTKPYRELQEVDMYAVLKTDDDNFQPKTDVYIVSCLHKKICGLYILI